VKAYYDRRAPEYDDWYEGRGHWHAIEREGWDDELHALEATLMQLPPARTLDVACGTAFLTRWLPGTVVGLDQSERMLGEARRRLPESEFVRGDALELPFPDGSFDRVFSGHFYGHLEPGQRERFLAEARRVAPELVVVDASLAHSDVDEERQERVLRDGSRWTVFKRFFTPTKLLEELGGGDALHDGRWFVAVRSPTAVR
jgi:ubiquinone/menaquinone biosynthesis C-methylase UbiE